MDAVFLVGGSSRIPLAATLLHRELGIAPTAIEQPELVVAQGSLRARPEIATRTASGPQTAAAEPASNEGPPVGEQVELAEPELVEPERGTARQRAAPRWRRRSLIAAGGVLIAGSAIALPALLADGTGHGANDGRGGGRNPDDPLEVIQVGEPGEAGIMGVVFRPDRTLLAAAYGYQQGGRRARLWGGAGRQWIGGWISDAQVMGLSPDGKFLATGYERVVRVWNTTNGVQVAKIDDEWNNTWTVTFSPDATTLAIGTTGSFVRRWSTADWTIRHPILYANDTTVIGTVAFRNDVKFVAAGDTAQGVRLWDMANAAKTPDRFEVDDNPTVHNDAVKVAFNPAGTILATSGYDGSVRLWSVPDHKPIGRIDNVKPDPAVFHWDLAFSPDGQTLAVGSPDGVLRLWDVATQRSTKQLPGHHGSIWKVALSPDGKRLATGGADGTIRLWATGKPNS